MIFVIDKIHKSLTPFNKLLFRRLCLLPIELKIFTFRFYGYASFLWQGEENLKLLNFYISLKCLKFSPLDLKNWIKTTMTHSKWIWCRHTSHSMTRKLLSLWRSEEEKLHLWNSMLKMIRRLKGSSRDYRITSKSICLCWKIYIFFLFLVVIEHVYQMMRACMRSNLPPHKIKWENKTASYIVEFCCWVYNALGE